MKRKKATKRRPNTLYPGRPNYVGPLCGVFAFLHHETLCEWSDNVMARVRYVRVNKPANEKKHRLKWMARIEPGPGLSNKLGGKLARLKEPRLDPWGTPYSYETCAAILLRSLTPNETRELMSIINKLVPDNSWNDNQLMFPR